ncbi:hypothetical protein CFC21_108646, partial [Triticum aestivum]
EFEKFTRVTMILPLTRAQYSDKVTENCVTYWKATSVYTGTEAASVDKFKAFKRHSFAPGASILSPTPPPASSPLPSPWTHRCRSPAARLSRAPGSTRPCSSPSSASTGCRRPRSSACPPWS